MATGKTLKLAAQVVTVMMEENYEINRSPLPFPFTQQTGWKDCAIVAEEIVRHLGGGVFVGRAGSHHHSGVVVGGGGGQLQHLGQLITGLLYSTKSVAGGAETQRILQMATFTRLPEIRVLQLGQQLLGCALRGRKGPD